MCECVTRNRLTKGSPSAQLSAWEKNGTKEGGGEHEKAGGEKDGEREKADKDEKDGERDKA